MSNVTRSSPKKQSVNFPLLAHLYQIYTLTFPPNYSLSMWHGVKIWSHVRPLVTLPFMWRVPWDEFLVNQFHHHRICCRQNVATFHLMDGKLLLVLSRQASSVREQINSRNHHYHHRPSPPFATLISTPISKRLLRNDSKFFRGSSLGSWCIGSSYEWEESSDKCEDPFKRSRSRHNGGGKGGGGTTQVKLPEWR